MNNVIDLSLLATIAIGHVGLWILFWNHVEGSGREKRVRRSQKILGGFCILAAPIWFAIHAESSWQPFWRSEVWHLNHWGLALYSAVCLYCSVVLAPMVIIQRYFATRPNCLKVTQSTVYHVPNDRRTAPTQRATDRLLLRFPGNQSLQIEQNTKQLTLARLPQGLIRLKIVHFADLHFSGKVGKNFFDRAVDIANDLEPDIVAITGDIVDVERYFCWIPATLGRLRPKHGAYFVLGNHDKKVDTSRLRMTLTESGISDIGSHWRRLSINGCELIIAGNEQPWLGRPPEMSDCPARDPRQMRLLLAHTPDLLPWARKHDFDLMLAGHTHNGQVCPPLTGPIVCPSRAPLAYVTGTIYQPPTLMHVTRGLSAELPIRLNSRPELSLLELRAKYEVIDKPSRMIPTDIRSPVSPVGHRSNSIQELSP